VEEWLKSVLNYRSYPQVKLGIRFWTTLYKLEVRTKQKLSTRRIFGYAKADIQAIKRELHAVDWYTQLGSLSAEDRWRVFRDKFETLEHKFISEKILSMKRKKPLWMTHKAHKVVCRKRQIYRKYKDTTHPAVIEASKAARREIKKAKKQFELKLAINIKEDRKLFFA